MLQPGRFEQGATEVAAPVKSHCRAMTPSRAGGSASDGHDLRALAAFQLFLVLYGLPLEDRDRLIAGSLCCHVNRSPDHVAAAQARVSGHGRRTPSRGPGIFV